MAEGRNLGLVLRIARLFLPYLRKKAEASQNELDNMAVEILEILLTVDLLDVE